jgi:hypothetical protein
MCNPVQEINNAFDTVSGWVSSTLSGLSSTIENVLKNPLPTIATIGLTAIGVPAPIANAMVTAATGGSMEDMVISLATSYAGGQIGAAIGDLAVPELGGIAGYGGAGDLAFQPAASEAILKTVISNASAQGATALLQGKDLDQVLNTALTGAVGGLINTSLRTQFGLDPSNFGDRLIGDATKAAVSSIFNGKDPGQAIGLALSNSAFGALANTAASGLKSTVKDLNDSTAEFETIKTQADGLREEIDSESTRLAGLSKELNSTSTALNGTQANIVASKDVLDIASAAYNGYFVVSDPAAQNAFAQRMGFEQLTDYEGVPFWAKNVQREKYIGYDDYGQRELERVASFDYVNIGTEAKAVAEQQAAYLNNTVPKFKEDVEKFNTQLATFNTDNTNLNTKVNTYTGLVTDLFGEDGEGGLNKKIENLLVARDGYIEDLNENVASLTEAAGEQISGAAEDIVDDAVDLLDQNYRTSDEVAEAFANNEAFQGYEPSAADLAKFIGEGKDADLQASIDTYVDENSVDLEELAEIAGLEGYTITDADRQTLVQQGNEKDLRDSLQARFDERAVTPTEAYNIFSDLGYKPSSREAGLFTGNRDENSVRSAIADYADKRSIDYSEARQALIAAGYDDPPDEVVNQLVGQSQDAYVPRQVRTGFAKSYKTVFDFVPSSDRYEAAGLQKIEQTYDPQFTTEDEVRQMYKDLGLPEPTDEEISQYIGKQAETDIYGKLEDVRDERNARLAKEAEDAEVAKKEAAAIEKGFPSYAVQQEFKDNVKAYKDSEAVKAGFPDDDTRTLYAGNVEKFIADENEKAALQSGFPDYATLQKYGGDINAYQDYQAEQTRIANESAAQSAGFPDYATQQKYQGDVKSYNAQLEADRIETQRVANEALAQKEGFPNYSIYSQFGGDLNAYTAAQNELMAKGAEFPDYKTYMEYGGDLNAYEQDLLERDAVAAGFPDRATQVQYGNSYEAYQAELQEQARLEEERIAEAARIEQEEADRVAREQAEAASAAEAKAESDRLAEAARIAQAEADAQAAEAARLAQEEADLEAARVAQEQADAQAAEAERLAEAARVAQEEADAQAARVAEQEARLAEEARLAKEAEDARIAQEAVNEELAQSNGFPDYATYLEFNGDENAYLASLAPADTLEGGEGNDTFGDIGFDTSVGIDGDDTLVGDDTLDAGAGNDTLISEKGDDEFDDTGFDTSPGLDGDDTFVGDDTLISGDGNDTLAGDDTLVAGDGEDTLVGDDTGFDTSPGLDGKDTLVGGAWGDETVNGEDGDDEVGPLEVHDTGQRPYSITDDDGNTYTVYPDGTYTLTPPIEEVTVTPIGTDTLKPVPDVANDPFGGDTPVVLDPANDPFGGDTPIVTDPANDPFGGDTPPVVISNPENDPFGGDTPVVTDPANDPLGGDMPEEEEEEIDPATGLPRVKVQPPPKTVTPPKKPITPLPPGLTPEQLMQLFGQLGAPGIMGALQPYEMPYYFQIPEEQQFDITEAFSPTLYRLQKE